MSDKAGYCSKCDKVLVWLKDKLRHGHFEDGFNCKTEPWNLKIKMNRQTTNKEEGKTI